MSDAQSLCHSSSASSTEEGVSCHNPVGFGACGHDGVFPDQHWRLEKLEANVYKIVIAANSTVSLQLSYAPNELG